jgi:hypothetical protein
MVCVLATETRTTATSRFQIKKNFNQTYRYLLILMVCVLATETRTTATSRFQIRKKKEKITWLAQNT